MHSILNSVSSGSIMEDALAGLENWCKAFNNFAVAFFYYMKFIFVFILLCIGILTLAKLRGLYKIERTKLAKKDIEGQNVFRKPRLILGTFYIVMASGILFNYFIYILIWCLEPLPDRFIFDFINFSGNIDPKYMNRIEDINAAKYPHEKTIYYCVAIASFFAILSVAISVAYIINSSNKNHKKPFTLLISGVAMGMLAGWTTCLPLLL